MSQYVDGNAKTFVAGGALGSDLRVILTSGKLALAGVGDKDIGTMTRDVFAVDEVVAVRLRSAAGTSKCVAAGAIAVGAEVFTAASGQVNDTAATGSFLYGTALEAATAAGDVIEVLRAGHGDTATS